MSNRIGAAVVALTLGIGGTFAVALPAIAEDAPPAEVVEVVEAAAPEADVSSMEIVVDEAPAAEVTASEVVEVQPEVLRTASPPPTVEVFWSLPNGGTDTNVTWPQTHHPDQGVLACGVWYQVDTYLESEAAGFYADGILTQGEDYGTKTQTGAIQWRFVYGGDCPPPPAQPNPAAAIVDGCGVADIVLSNDLGKDAARLTASIVVWVDGEFYGAYAVAGGTTQALQILFDEDSGTHHVEVRTGAAFGDVFLNGAKIGSDCIPPQPEPIVDTKTTTATDCAADTVTTTTATTTTEYVLVEGEWVLGTPVVEVVDVVTAADDTACPPPVVKTIEPTSNALAFTGAPTNPLLFGGIGFLVVLLGVVVVTAHALHRRTN